MKKPIIFGLVLISALFFSGCATNRIVDFSPYSSWAKGFQLNTVRLEPKLAALTDRPTGLGSQYTVLTGKMFATAFTGGTDAPASLDIVNSAGDIQARLGAFIINPNLHATYSASVVLRYRGHTQTFFSSAKGHSGLGDLPALQQAIARVIMDLEKQIEVCMNEPAPVPAIPVTAAAPKT